MKYLIVMAAALVACSDESAATTNTNNPFTPAASSGSDGTSSGGTGTSSGATSSGGTSSGDNAACGQPAGCFCGTPVTQADFLNRCTRAAALPVDLRVTPATTANVP